MVATEIPDRLGTLLADSGYWSIANSPPSPTRPTCSSGRATPAVGQVLSVMQGVGEVVEAQGGVGMVAAQAASGQRR
jgi:hypothetical protein